MKLAHAQGRSMSAGERLSVLERRVDEHDEMKTMVKEMHDLLFGAKAILWFLTKASAWTGGGVTIAGGLTLIVKFFTGH